MKPLPEMSAFELRGALLQAIEEEKLAEYIDGLGPWYEAKTAAIARQNALIAEMVRRRTHFEAVNGSPEGIGNVG